MISETNEVRFSITYQEYTKYWEDMRKNSSKVYSAFGNNWFLVELSSSPMQDFVFPYGETRYHVTFRTECKL